MHDDRTAAEPRPSDAGPTTDPPLIPTATSTPTDAKRAIRGGILGNFVDQFDIFLPVIALAPAAAHLFGSGNLARNAALIFIATLIARPVGAAIFGPMADRIGRSTTAKLTIAGVAVTTLLIALVPPQFSEDGALAWILALRFLGGIFLGGGYTSAVPLAMEWSVPHRRGLVSGMIMWMSPWANATIAALTFILLTCAGPAAYDLWGWRMPFIIGAALAVAMLAFYHRYVSDEPVASQTAAARRPLGQIFVGAHGRRLAPVFVLMSGLWLFTDMAIAVLTGQLSSVGHLDGQATSFTMFVATAASAVAMVASGHLSTITGRRRFFIAFGTLSAMIAPVVYLLVFQQQPLGATVAWVVALQLVTVSAYGPIAAYLTELFPTAVRSTGYGVAYSLSIVLPALYPYYLPPLQRALGTQPAVALLLTLAGLLVALGAALGPVTDTHAELAV
jgi:MFS family permease